MEWILVVTLVLFVLLVVVSPVTCGRHRHPRWIRDVSNVRQLAVTIQAYTADHGNQPPPTMLNTRDYFGTDGDELFQSPYDHQASLVFEDTPEAGWYQYGSYWFLAADALLLDKVEQPAEFILVYRTPRLDHDMYIAGYLDGRAQVLSIDEFNQQMKRQDELLQEEQPELPEHDA